MKLIKINIDSMAVEEEQELKNYLNECDIEFEIEVE